MADNKKGNGARRLRSREWFDAPGDPTMASLYLERYMNFGLTLAELHSGRPIIGIAHPVLAEAGDIARRGALADGGDGCVLRVAAEALQPGAAVAFLGTIEFDQRLADRDDGRRGGHGVRGFPWCRTALKGGRHG